MLRSCQAPNAWAKAANSAVFFFFFFFFFFSFPPVPTARLGAGCLRMGQELHCYLPPLIPLKRSLTLQMARAVRRHKWGRGFV